MKHHKEIIHVGVRNCCDSCYYNATLLSNLKKHTESKHEGQKGVSYSCDCCDTKIYFFLKNVNDKEELNFSRVGVEATVSKC